MNRVSYLAKNTFIFALGNLGTKLITFFLVPLYTNVLSTSEYGITDFVFSICSFAVPIIILNINEAIMRFALDKDADNNKIMTAGLLVMLFSFGIGVLLGIGSKFYGPTSELAVLIYLYAITLGMSYILVSYLRGQELLLRFSIGNIIQAFSTASFNIILLLGFNMGIAGYLLAYVLANIVTCIYAFFAGNVKEVFKHLSVNPKLWLEMIKYSIVLIPNSFMWWIINSANRLMLISMINLSVSGIYAVANKIPAMISIVSTVFNQAFSYSAIKEEDSGDKEAFNNKVFEYLLSIVVIAGICLLIFIKPFMRIYVGDAFFEAWILTPPLIIGTCILVLATFLSVSYTVHKDSRGFLFSGTLGAITNVILNLLLIPVWGAYGAAIATLISYFIVLVYRCFDTQKYIKIKVFTAKHVASLLSLCVAGAMTYMNEIVGITVSIVLLIISVYLYRDNWKEVIRLICKKLKRG